MYGFSKKPCQVHSDSWIVALWSVMQSVINEFLPYECFPLMLSVVLKLIRAECYSRQDVANAVFFSPIELGWRNLFLFTCSKKLEGLLVCLCQKMRPSPNM